MRWPLVPCILALTVMAIPPAPATGAEVAAEDRPELKIGRSADYDYDVPEPGTYRLPRIKKAGDGVVLGMNGERLRLRKLVKGKITVLSFIYTQCPDPRACPMATGALRDLHKVSLADERISRNLQLMTLSFDPAMDTPEVMKAFAKANRPQAKGAPWRFLTTPSRKTLDPILQAYGQVVDRRPNNPLQRITHPVRVYLIDRKGQIRNIYSFGMLDPRMVMTDVRTLLAE